MSRRFSLWFCLIPLLLTGPLAAQDVEPIVSDPSLNLMRGLTERYAADEAAVRRSVAVPESSSGRERMRQFLAEWLYRLEHVDFDRLQQDERIDFLLLQNRLQYEGRRLELEQRREAETDPLVPFAQQIVQLAEARRAMRAIDPRGSAETLVDLSKQLTEASARLRRESPKDVTPVVARRALSRMNRLRRVLAEWHRFYDGYDPLFSWWTKAPYKQVTADFDEYSKLVADRLVGTTDKNALIGDPIGRAGLLSELRYEMIPYTPEELLEIANQEFAWCEREMQRAATDLGHNGDWHKALEHVKSLHAEPGQQPQMIRELALEAIEFLRQRDLVTIPRLCEEIWRMSMLSPERQKVSPYFLGGETIQVAFPTDEMDHAAKLMSLRGNNRHFARATVHHELIPGHHLQGFMSARYRTHRRQFRTPFLVEGWALHWEMLLWDLQFQQSAEDRVGMLFWRAHRCARIIFSLNFHLGKMSAEECVAFLTERVGHEPNNARAEVLRSIKGDYGPLYQAAYMLGGLQMRSLHRQLVGGKRMTNREFHDAVLLENSIPLEMIRASLLGTPLSRDYQPQWRFYDRP